MTSGGGELGANTQEALSGGLAAEEAAVQLKDLPSDFEDLVSAVGKKMSHAPGVGTWDVFGESHASHMESVKNHAETLAENIQSGAHDVSATDAEGGEIYEETNI